MSEESILFEEYLMHSSWPWDGECYGISLIGSLIPQIFRKLRNNTCDVHEPIAQCHITRTFRASIGAHRCKIERDTCGLGGVRDYAH